MEQNLWTWIFPHVVLPLMPVAGNLLVVKILKIREEWDQIFKDGKLFIFSSTLSGSSISLRFFQGSQNNDLETVCFWLLLINIGISSFLLGIGNFLQLRRENYVKLRQEEEKKEDIDLHFFAIASICCSVLAIVCSYLIS